MAKRFTDTDIWKKPWFRALTPPEKAAWKYITDQCDNVGVWDADTELADFMIGQPIDWKQFRARCNGNIEEMPNGKWWLVDFCSFQHPDLNEASTSNAVRSYVSLLKRHNLWERFMKGSPRVCEGSWERERERDREEEKEAAEKRGRVSHPTLDVPIGQTRYDNLCREWGRSVVDSYVERAVAYAEAHSKPYSDYAAAAWTYMQRDLKDGKLQPRPKDEGPRTFAEAREMG